MLLSGQPAARAEAPVDRTHSIPYSACGAGERGRLNGSELSGIFRGWPVTEAMAMAKQVVVYSQPG